jgi:hypothetical protein
LEINNEVYEGIALSLNKMQNLPEFPSGSTESQSKRPGPLRLAKGLGLRSELLSGQEDESVTPCLPCLGHMSRGWWQSLCPLPAMQRVHGSCGKGP